jgi:hypothetical protein
MVERRRIWNEQGLGALARPTSAAAEVGQEGEGGEGGGRGARVRPWSHSEGLGDVFGAMHGGGVGAMHGGGVGVSERDGDGNWTQRRIGSVVGDEAVIAGDSVLVSSESLFLSATVPGGARGGGGGRGGGGAGTTGVMLCDYLENVDSSLTLEGEERFLEFEGGQVQGGGQESEWARDGGLAGEVRDGASAGGTRELEEDGTEGQRGHVLE